ncbi:hypothetical protein [Streptomyces sp. RKAG337]|uniref:hypothetical protein n=1 Tax=Streptomyces sp. RKAG337 TaxID=2893404 RepID=UPI0020337A0E|nr:hypothetical protein [Streptomyces sp. RKAG337]MCM2427368.1 hypothetical protein [Streptomyces sp. RKAG337]
MPSDLGREVKEALLTTIKEHGEKWQNEPASIGAAAALRDLAEAYAWLERPARVSSN